MASASNRYNWWTNDTMMSAHDIRSYMDIRSDSMSFQKIVNGIACIITVPMEELERKHVTIDRLNDLFDHKYKQAPTYVHMGPSNEDLNIQSVNDAWNEFRVLYRLSTGKVL